MSSSLSEQLQGGVAINVAAVLYHPDYPVQIGQPVKIFRQGSKRALLGLRVLALTSLLVAMAFFLLTFIGGWPGLLKNSSLTADLVFLGLAALVIWVGYPKIASYLREWNDVAVVGDRGFGYRHNGQWQQMAWDEIDGFTMVKERGWSFSGGGDEYGMSALFDLFMMFMSGYRCHYWATSTDGKRVVVAGTLSQAEKLMETIRERAFSSLGRRAMADFAAGRDVTFGPVVANKSLGLRYRQTQYGWDNIRSIRVSPGDDHYLKIKPKDGRFLESIKVPECEVPNVDVLFYIAAQMMGCPQEKYNRLIESLARRTP